MPVIPDTREAEVGGSLEPREVEATVSHDTPLYSSLDDRVRPWLQKIERRKRKPQWPLDDEWINIIWHISTMECYSAIQKKVLMHATVKSNLRNIVN